MRELFLVLLHPTGLHAISILETSWVVNFELRYIFLLSDENINGSHQALGHLSQVEKVPEVDPFIFVEEPGHLEIA